MTKLAEKPMMACKEEKVQEMLEESQTRPI